jgi:UDP-N-acetylglucosamine--N-acetylmuramyl-(pentapeptide) pyrophosphoryl-undecaprenol N-acetylglucosamine transferase
MTGPRLHALHLQLAASPVPGDAAAAGSRLAADGAEAPPAVVLAGGSTGGHLFPGVAVAEEFRECDARSRILFISRGTELERRVLGQAGFPLECISAAGLKGRGLWNQLRALCSLPRGVLQSRRLLKAFKPDIVIGLGSYAAAPVVAAARLQKMPIVLCEQNTLPGITNRLLARTAERIYTSFEKTGGGFDRERVIWTGNPLRRDIVKAAMDRVTAAPAGSSPDRFTVLVIGGSQGAHSINLAVTAAIEHLAPLERLFFVHQTGTADEETVRSTYLRHGVAGRVQAFFDDMAAQYRQADLVICRAGATTVAEITALGKAAIVIPFPHAADDHQRLNAAQLVAKGAAEMITEDVLDGARLAERIRFYAGTPAALRAMADQAAQQGRPEAAKRIVEDCCRIIARRRLGRRANGSTNDVP